MKDFIYKLISSNQDVSSKRVIGIICIIFSMLVFILSLIFNFNIDSIKADILKTFLFTGAIMITGGVLDGLFNKK